MKESETHPAAQGAPCSVALYRLPGAAMCRIVAQQGSPAELPSAVALNDRSGFVLAPFAVSGDDRLLLLQPDREEAFAVGDISPDGHLPIAGSPTVEAAFRTALSGRRDAADRQTTRQHYAVDFANFHAQLTEGRFQKLVLARSAFVSGNVQSPVALFRKACQLYPYAFVALVTTPGSGTWLMATPEILLEEKDGLWHTIALAGTMEAGESLAQAAWSTKNIVEQRYVATYIMQCLECFADDIREEGPVTVRASNVVHLRSDFHFSLPDVRQIGTLLQALHPTPAVCGLPKDEACAMIVRNEAAPRHYYSGFCGPLQTDAGTHLFVSLRCMQLLSDGYRLYAGGGLLPDSVEEQEWLETEAKMQAMRQLITPNPDSRV